MVRLNSSNKELVEGFQWACEQARKYVFNGDPVGPWYEAALPNRMAFCIRDVSHQSSGAHILGLETYTHNMMKKFAQSISPTRDWCGYWEINKYDLPAPVDYENDQDFWYNLPANFDVIDCCWRQYNWSGISDYINGDDFVNFYDKSMHEYAATWDTDCDGFLEAVEGNGRRGIGSYNEHVPNIKMGADLLATHYRASVIYAKMLVDRGYERTAKHFVNKAEKIRDYYENEWWDDSNGSYYELLLQDNSFFTTKFRVNHSIMYFGLIQNGYRMDKELSLFKVNVDHTNVEGLSYLSEVLYRYGRNDVAFETLMKMMNAKLKRREYPEVSFSCVGTVAEGMMGMKPDISTSTISSLSRLTSELDWVELSDVKVMGITTVSLCHDGLNASTMVNIGDKKVTWEANFIGNYKELNVDGKPEKAKQYIGIDGKIYSKVAIKLESKQSVRVSI